MRIKVKKWRTPKRDGYFIALGAQWGEQVYPSKGFILTVLNVDLEFLTETEPKENIADRDTR